MSQTTPSPAAGSELELISGSGPVYGDLYRQAVELVGKPPKGEISLQRLDGTNVYQWHYRIAVFWEPWGQQMYIEQPKLAAQNNATYEAVMKAIGEDDVLTKDEADGKCEDIGININAYIKEARNSLRAELRKSIAKIYGRGE